MTTQSRNLIEQLLEDTATSSDQKEDFNSALFKQENEFSEMIIEALNDNEKGDGKLFAEAMEGHFCYDHAEKSWYKFNGNFWEIDVIEEAFEGVSDVVNMYKKAAEVLAKDRIQAITCANNGQAHKLAEIEKNIKKRTFTLDSDTRRNKVLKFARAGSDGLGISGDNWDQDPWLLGCKNGVIDLKTGNLFQGRYDHYIRHASPIEYTGLNTKAPKWDKFISEIFNQDKELVSYIQRLFGYAMTGETREHILPILWGAGRNGKSLLLEMIDYVLGSLAGSFQTDVLLETKSFKSSSSPSPDIAALYGLRLAWCSETSDEKHLNESRVKYLTGGDKVVARPLYCNTITFTPTHTLFLLTNFRPQINSYDYAIWQRVHLIPFCVSFVENPERDGEKKRNIYLSDELKQESSGILSWLIRGCLEWQKIGLKPPAIVKSETDRYQSESDVVQQFIDERCEIRSDIKTQAKKIYDSYCDWCKSSGYEPYTITKFGNLLGL